MIISQAISYVKTYMSNNIDIIDNTYSKLSKLFLEVKKRDATDAKYFKSTYKKEYGKIDELLEKAKKGRTQFIEAITLLRENKKEDDVELGCSNFLLLEDRLKDRKKRVEKLASLISHYEDEVRDKAEDDNNKDSLSYNYKRIKVTKTRDQTERLNNLINSNLKFLGEVTSIYDNKEE